MGGWSAVIPIAALAVMLMAFAPAVLAQVSAPKAAQAQPQTAAQEATRPEPVAMPRVEVIGAQESDDTNRRRESIAKAIYGREELDRQGDIDLTDVLKRLPGVSMDAGAPRLRGLGGGYTQVLLNGEPMPPGFSIDSLAPGDVERIEVIKGATAEFSGVAGTINVVLREPPRTLLREWRANASYRAVQPGGMTAFQWGDRVGDVSFVIPVNISRSAQGTDTTSARISRTPAAEVRAQTIDGHDTGRSGNAQLAPRLQWKISETDSLNFSVFAQRTESVGTTARDITDVQGPPSFTVRDQSQTESVAEVRRVQMQWQRKWTEGGKLELKSSWQQTTRRSAGDYAGWQADTSPSLQRQSLTDLDESRASAGARWSQPLGLAHTLLTGWDVDLRQRDELRRVWDNGIERLDASDGVLFAARMERSVLFVQDEWNASDRWSLLPGLRLERLRTRSGDIANGPTAEIDNIAHVLAPVLHLNFRLDPQGKDQLRASLTRSFKLPELGALLGRYVFNTTYEREVSNTPIAADRAGNPALQRWRAQHRLFQSPHRRPDSPGHHAGAGGCHRGAALGLKAPQHGASHQPGSGV
jgi:iron complex outermembrane receptor protein